MMAAALALFLVFGQDAAPRTIDKGGQSEIAVARQATARDREEWTALWRSHAPGRPEPAVDFSKEMVVGVFMGTRQTAGFAVEIVGYRDLGGDALVRYRETVPASGAIAAQVLTAPFHLVVIPRQAGRITFEKIQP